MHDGELDEVEEEEEEEMGDRGERVMRRVEAAGLVCSFTPTDAALIEFLRHMNAHANE